MCVCPCVRSCQRLPPRHPSPRASLRARHRHSLLGSAARAAAYLLRRVCHAGRRDTTSAGSHTHPLRTRANHRRHNRAKDKIILFLECVTTEGEVIAHQQGLCDPAQQSCDRRLERCDHGQDGSAIGELLFIPFCRHRSVCGFYALVRMI